MDIFKRIDLIPSPIPPFRLEQMERDKRVFQGRKKTAEAVGKILIDAINNGKAVEPFPSGLPGSGKTDLGGEILRYAVENNIISADEKFLGTLDSFIGTARESRARPHLTKRGRAFFREHYMRYHEAVTAIEKAEDVIVSGKGGTVILPREYQRNANDPDVDGKILPGKWEIPPGCKLFCVEGTGAINEVALKLQPHNGIVRVRIFVHGEIVDTLLNAVLRDIVRDKKNKPGMAFLEFRVEEYEHLIEAQQECARNADIVCVRFPTERDFQRTALKKITKARETSQEKAAVVNTFLNQLPAHIRNHVG